jgi:hypothetical protein
MHLPTEIELLQESFESPAGGPGASGIRSWLRRGDQKGVAVLLAEARRWQTDGREDVACDNERDVTMNVKGACVLHGV